MQTITKSDIIRDVAKTWGKRYLYGRNQKDKQIYNKLLNLPSDATETDIYNIIGNYSWTRLQCDECGEDANIVVCIGDVVICEKCINKAVILCSKV